MFNQVQPVILWEFVEFDSDFYKLNFADFIILRGWFPIPKMKIFHPLLSFPPLGPQKNLLPPQVTTS